MSFESWWNDQDRVRDGENNKKVCKIIWERIEISNHTKIKELEKELAYYKAIYNPLIDGAARDTNRINELENKLEVAVEALEKIKDLSMFNRFLLIEDCTREALIKIKTDK